MDGLCRKDFLCYQKITEFVNGRFSSHYISESPTYHIFLTSCFEQNVIYRLIPSSSTQEIIFFALSFTVVKVTQ